MIGYETAEYHTIHSVCSKEGLDTEYVLYKVNAEGKNKWWRLIQAILSEIHDTLGHSLTGAIIQLEVARKLIDKNSDTALEAIIRSQEITRSGFNDVKRAIKALNPLGIEELSLSECVHQLIQEARDSYNFHIEHDIDLPDNFPDTLK